MLLFPARDGYPRSFSRCTFNFKVVDQPFRAGQAQTQSVTGSPAFAHREIHVRDAWTLILESEAQPNPSAVFQALAQQGAAAAVDNGVPSQFARCGHELRLVDEAEAEFLSERPNYFAR